MTADEARARIKIQAAELRKQVEEREQRRKAERATPPAYLSTSEGRWRVISQGLPVGSDKATAAEAMRFAEKYRMKIAPVSWNGDRGEWVDMDTIEELSA
jgi:hypothetical protein